MRILQVSRYQTSSDALIRALEVEAAYNSSRSCYKARVAELETGENEKLEKLLEKFSPQIINGLAQGRDIGAPPTKSMECWDISNAIVVFDHQLQGEAHNTDLLNEICRKTKNS